MQIPATDRPEILSVSNMQRAGVVLCKRGQTDGQEEQEKVSLLREMRIKIRTPRESDCSAGSQHPGQWCSLGLLLGPQSGIVKLEACCAH